MLCRWLKTRRRQHLIAAEVLPTAAEVLPTAAEEVLPTAAEKLFFQMVTASPT